MSGKGVREVEGIDLERLYGSNTIEGSNPSLSFNKNVFKIKISFKKEMFFIKKKAFYLFDSFKIKVFFLWKTAVMVKW